MSEHRVFEGSRLQCARQVRGLTRWDIAKALEINVPKVGRWERGEQDPTDAQIRYLSFFLQFPESFFFGPPLELDYKTSLDFHS